MSSSRDLVDPAPLLRELDEHILMLGLNRRDRRRAGRNIRAIAQSSGGQASEVLESLMADIAETGKVPAWVTEGGEG